MILRPLRGRVVVREDRRRTSVIIDPLMGNPREETTHRGVVLAMGAPAYACRHLDALGRCQSLTCKHPEVPWGFSTGDTVQFHFAGTEKGRTVDWTDGEPALWLAQHEIDAVVE